MSETFYIASSRDGLADVREVARYLTERGMVNAFPWPEHFDHKCSADGCGIRGRADLARRELLAASTCSLFVGIARMGKGTHVELGAALTGRAVHPKRVILVGVVRSDSAFYDVDDVEHARDVAQLFEMLPP